MTQNSNWLNEQPRDAIPDGQRVADIVVIDLGPVFAGARDDEFEERFKVVLREVEASAGRIVLFMGLRQMDPITHLYQRHETVRAELDQAIRDADWERAARWTYESRQIEQEIAAGRWASAEDGAERESMMDGTDGWTRD